MNEGRERESHPQDVLTFYHLLPDVSHYPCVHICSHFAFAVLIGVCVVDVCITN